MHPTAVRVQSKAKTMLIRIVCVLLAFNAAYSDEGKPLDLDHELPQTSRGGVDYPFQPSMTGQTGLENVLSETELAASESERQGPDIPSPIRLVLIFSTSPAKKPVWPKDGRTNGAANSSAVTELTPWGLHEAWNYGQGLRQKYVDALKFLPTNFTSSQFYTRAADYDHTITNAQAILTGLYPPGTGPTDNFNSKFHHNFTSALPYQSQVFPVHTQAAKNDVLLHAFDKCLAAFDYLKVLYTSPEWEQKEKDLSQLFEQLTPLAGYPVGLRNISAIAVPLKDSLDDGVAPPPGFTQHIIDETLQAYNWSVSVKFKDEYIARLSAGYLVRQVIQMMDSAVTMGYPRYPYKMILLSASDINMMMLMTALQQPMNGLPPANSKIVVELVSNTTANPNHPSDPFRSKQLEDYYLRASYNGQPLKLLNKTEISMYEFKGMLFQQRIAITYERWAKECLGSAGNNNGPGNCPNNPNGPDVVLRGFSRGTLAVTAIALSLGCTVIGIGIGYYWHHRKTRDIQRQYRELVQKGVLTY